MSTTETEPTDEGGDPPCWAHLYDTEDPDALVDDAALARLVRDLADAVVICDPDGTIRFWNTAATHIFGWTADEATGASLDLIIPERLRERHWAGYQRVMATGHTDYGGRLLEVPALHRDGRTLSIAFTVSLLRHSAKDAVTAIAAVIRDDTERWHEHQRLRLELNGRTPGPAPHRAVDGVTPTTHFSRPPLDLSNATDHDRAHHPTGYRAPDPARPHGRFGRRALGRRRVTGGWARPDRGWLRRPGLARAAARGRG